MKPVLFLVGVFVLCSMPLSAQAVETETTQTVKNDQAYFTANLQKHPEKNGKQGITNHFTFFTINVQINGKIKDSADNNK